MLGGGRSEWLDLSVRLIAVMLIVVQVFLAFDILLRLGGMVFSYCRTGGRGILGVVVYLGFYCGKLVDLCWLLEEGGPLGYFSMFYDALVSDPLPSYFVGMGCFGTWCTYVYCWKGLWSNPLEAVFCVVAVFFFWNLSIAFLVHFEDRGHRGGVTEFKKDRYRYFLWSGRAGVSLCQNSFRALLGRKLSSSLRKRGRLLLELVEEMAEEGFYLVCFLARWFSGYWMLERVFGSICGCSREMLMRIMSNRNLVLLFEENDVEILVEFNEDTFHLRLGDRTTVGDLKLYLRRAFGLLVEKSDIDIFCEKRLLPFESFTLHEYAIHEGICICMRVKGGCGAQSLHEIDEVLEGEIGSSLVGVPKVAGSENDPSVGLTGVSRSGCGSSAGCILPVYRSCSIRIPECAVYHLVFTSTFLVRHLREYLSSITGKSASAFTLVCGGRMLVDMGRSLFDYEVLDRSIVDVGVALKGGGGGGGGGDECWKYYCTGE